MDKEYIEVSVNGSVETALKEAMIMLDAVCNTVAETAPIEEAKRAELANELKKMVVDFQADNLDTRYEAWKADQVR